MEHNAGLGSLINVVFSQLIQMPEDADVAIHMVARDYGNPHGENMFPWFFRENPDVRFDDESIPLWPGTTYDDTALGHNLRLGDMPECLAKLRRLRRQHFPIAWSRVGGPLFKQDGVRTLGVHYRGTDKHTECPRQPYEKALAAITRFGPVFDEIFMATDEAEAAQWFADRVPGLLLSAHERASKDCGTSLFWHSLSRRQAEEAMVDILRLAACDTLLVGRGNFSDMALIFGNTKRIFYIEDF